MPGHRVIDCYPVVYSYPKTGIQFVFVPEGEGDAHPYPASVIMDLETMRAAVERRDRRRRALLLEASGGVTLDSVREVAKTGVDRIAVGAITHSAVQVDFGLDIE